MSFGIQCLSCGYRQLTEEGQPQEEYENIVNAGSTPQGNQNVHQVKATANDQIPVNPPAMKDGEVRAALFQMA